MKYFLGSPQSVDKNFRAPPKEVKKKYGPPPVFTGPPPPVIINDRSLNSYLCSRPSPTNLPTQHMYKFTDY